MGVRYAGWLGGWLVIRHGNLEEDDDILVGSRLGVGGGRWRVWRSSSISWSLECGMLWRMMIGPKVAIVGFGC